MCRHGIELGLDHWARCWSCVEDAVFRLDATWGRFALAQYLWVAYAPTDVDMAALLRGGDRPMFWGA